MLEPGSCIDLWNLVFDSSVLNKVNESQGELSSQFLES